MQISTLSPRSSTQYTVNKYYAAVTMTYRHWAEWRWNIQPCRHDKTLQFQSCSLFRHVLNSAHAYAPTFDVGDSICGNIGHSTVGQHVVGFHINIGTALIWSNVLCPKSAAILLPSANCVVCLFSHTLSTPSSQLSFPLARAISVFPFSVVVSEISPVFYSDNWSITVAANFLALMLRSKSTSSSP